MAENEKIKSFDELRDKMGLPPRGPRVDGRHYNEMRPLEIALEFHRTNQVLVQFGNTRVICSASIENRVPQWRYGSGLGWLTAEYSILPGATDQRTQRERGISVSGRTHEIQRLIGRALRSVVKLGSLGQVSIYVDCDVISADGGTRCTSITGGFLAMYSLLKANAQRWLAWPVIEPICAVSVGVVDGKTMLDLNYKEDSSAQVDGNFVVRPGGKLVDLGLCAEESSFTKAQMEELVSLAEKGAAEIFLKVDEAMAKIDRR